MCDRANMPGANKCCVRGIFPPEHYRHCSTSFGVYLPDLAILYLRSLTRGRPAILDNMSTRAHARHAPGLFSRVSDRYRYRIVRMVASSLTSPHAGFVRQPFSRVSFDPTKRWQRAARVLLPPKYAGKMEAGLTPTTNDY